MQFTTINQQVLHFQDEGSATGPPLVFVNSLGTDLRIWDALIPHFAASYRIIRHDKRGHGLSACPPPPYTIRQHAEDLVGLLDRLQVGKAILIGISVGGMIALDFAAQHPQRLAKLVLCDTAPKIGTPAMWDERIAALRAHGMAHLGEAILARWFAPEFAAARPDAYRGYGNMLTRTPVDGYTGTCEAIRDADLWPQVGRIQAPTLVLCGAEDLATPPAQAQQLAAALPNASCTIIDGAAHLPCIEQPHVMAAIIANFLK
ncbi:MAG: 3-oxoadipate enol-lactonase [Caldilineaceae bacterium]